MKKRINKLIEALKLIKYLTTIFEEALIRDHFSVLLRQLQLLLQCQLLFMTFLLQQPLLLCHLILDDQTGNRRARSLASQFLLWTSNQVPLRFAKKLLDPANAMFQVSQDQHFRPSFYDCLSSARFYEILILCFHPTVME